MDPETTVLQPYPDGASANNVQVQVDIDRFFNLLPFNSRMPRNQFFADLASKVAHECLSNWSQWTGRKPKVLNSGIFIPR